MQRFKFRLLTAIVEIIIIKNVNLKNRQSSSSNDTNNYEIGPSLAKLQTNTHKSVFRKIENFSDNNVRQNDCMYPSVVRTVEVQGNNL